MQYEHGPWIDIPEGGMCERETMNGAPFFSTGKRIRILTPKPKREFVVGKWYKDKWGDNRRILFVDKDSVWFTSPSSENMSFKFTKESAERNIDWSVAPRDEAP